VSLRRLAFVLVAVIATGCHSASPNVTGSTADPPSPSASRAIDPNVDAGQRIEIHPGAFYPAQLIAVVNQPIVWANLTSKPVEVVFDSGTVRSGEIQPGGTFSYTSNAAVSVAYHAGGDPTMKATIQFEVPYMPGETPSVQPT
jgi:hypothetical protein